MKTRIASNLYILFVLLLGSIAPAWAGGYSWLFITDSDEKIATKVKERFPAAAIKKSKGYLCVYLSRPEFEAPNDLLQKFSARYEVYWVTVSSTTEYFQYLHWSKGALVRALDMKDKTDDSDQLVWGIVSGKPEPWEAEAFKPLINGGKPSAPRLGSDVPRFDSKSASDIVMGYYKFEPLWLNK